MKVSNIKNIHYGDMQDWVITIIELTLEDTAQLKQLFKELNIDRYEITGRCYAYHTPDPSTAAYATIFADKETTKKLVIDTLKDERFNEMIL